MAGLSNKQNDVVWPGYVAAMASLLLSLLMVCAILVVTIGQIGTLSDGFMVAISESGFSSASQLERQLKQAGFSEERLSEMSRSPSAGSATSFEVNPATELDPNGIIRKGAAFKFARPIALNLQEGWFDPQAAQRAAQLASQDRELLAQIDLSRVDLRKIRFSGIDLRGVKFNRALTPKDMQGIDFSKVDFGRLRPDLIEKLKPIIAQEAMRYQLALLKSGGKVSTANLPISVLAPPPSPVVTAAQAKLDEPIESRDHFLVTFVDEAAEPSAQQRQQVAQIFTELRNRNVPVRIWAEIPPDNEYLQRLAYARLITLRSWALQAGFDASRLAVKLERAPATAVVREISFHVVVQN